MDNSDSYFCIGAGHDVCQDYALHGTYPMDNGVNGAYAILSDGCSGSPHTDFGSRFLCKAAESLVATGTKWDRAIYSANTMRNSCGLGEESLDATLLTAITNSFGCYVEVHGDGVVAVRNRITKEMAVTRVSYPSGYPAYLSYNLSPRRKEAYTKSSGEVAQYTDTYLNGNITLAHNDANPWNEVMLTYSRLDFDLVMLFSDGVESFTKRDSQLDVVDVTFHDVIASMSDIKSTAGSFITRRARSFLSKENKKLHHHDDFSVGAILMEV